MSQTQRCLHRIPVLEWFTHHLRPALQILGRKKTPMKKGLVTMCHWGVGFLMYTYLYLISISLSISIFISISLSLSISLSIYVYLSMYIYIQINQRYIMYLMKRGHAHGPKNESRGMGNLTQSTLIGKEFGVRNTGSPEGVGCLRYFLGTPTWPSKKRPW